jgi:hypothetical protein
MKFESVVGLNDDDDFLSFSFDIWLKRERLCLVFGSYIYDRNVDDPDGRFGVNRVF